MTTHTCNNNSSGAVGTLDKLGTAECSKGCSGFVPSIDARCGLRVGNKLSASKVQQCDSMREESEAEHVGETFMAEYMHHLDEELKESATEDVQGVSVDMSCVADLLRSVEEGTGQPGAADGLIGMLGLRLPKSSS